MHLENCASVTVSVGESDSDSGRRTRWNDLLEDRSFSVFELSGRYWI